ncbi:hypothetical protein [Streptomyces mirabilis]
MVRTARERLEDATGKLATAPHANRLLPLIARGAAQRSTLAAMALERRHVRAADRRAFPHLAERPDVEPQSAAFFAMLADCRTVVRRPILQCGEEGHPDRVAW